MPLKVEEKDGAIFFGVKVVPNSSRDMLAGLLGDRLKIKVAQPPEEGKANRAVERLLARTFGVAESQVGVVAGLSNPLKTIRVMGISAAELLAKIS